MYTSLETGKIGEAICLYRLLQMQVNARLVEMGAYDIVADHEGMLIRIQVKSSQMKKNKDSKGYQFCITKGGRDKQSLSFRDCDIVALVAIEQENVIFIPVSDVADIKTKRLQPMDFLHPSAAYDSWYDSLKVATAYLLPREPDPQYQF